MFFKIKSITLLVIIGFLVLSCRKKDIAIDNLNDNKISVFGHAGMGISSLYPANSFESIQKCVNSGSDGVEIDIQMTKDSVLVAFHDQDLSERTSFNGNINNYTWSELQNVKYKSSPYTDYSIVSLNSIFNGLNDLQKRQYSLDLKLPKDVEYSNEFLQTFVNSITKITSKYNIRNNVFLETNNYDFLTILCNNNLSDKLFVYASNFETALEQAKEKSLYGISISNSIVSAEQVEIAHDNNFRVVIWNVSSKKKNLSAIKKNPDFIQTDNLIFLVRLLK